MKKLIIPFLFIFSLISLTPVFAETVGETLTGQYTYSDPEGDPEGVSTFQWYRDNVAIPGATSRTYTATSLDEGKTLIFEVTPVSLTGISPGAPIRSTGILITAAPVTTTSRTTSGGYLPGYGPKPTIVTAQPATLTTTLTPTATIISTTPPPTFTTTLKPKARHPDVKLLQSYLNSRGFTVASTGPGSLGNETNFFGPATKAAVIKFQKANNLKADGIVGQLTRGKMK